MAGFEQYWCQKFEDGFDEACDWNGGLLSIQPPVGEVFTVSLELHRRFKPVNQTRKPCRLSGQDDASGKETRKKQPWSYRRDFVRSHSTKHALWKAGLELQRAGRPL
jgi:hypothetical protein